MGYREGKNWRFFRRLLLSELEIDSSECFNLGAIIMLLSWG